MYSTCVLYDGPVLVVIAHMSCTEIGMAPRPKMLGFRPDGGRRDGPYVVLLDRSLYVVLCGEAT